MKHILIILMVILPLVLTNGCATSGGSDNKSYSSKSGSVWVKGHYRTSKTGKKYWVKGHYRKK